MLPYLFHIGHISLPTFGAAAASGLMLSLWLSQYAAKRAGVNPQQLWDAGLLAVITAFVLSRVLLAAAHWHAFLAAPALLLSAPSLTAPGLLLTVVVTCLWLWWKGVDLRRALDTWAPCGALVWAFLALGHLAEGSDPGLESAWGLRLPGEAVWTHPVALYAFLLALLIAWASYRRLGHSARPGATAGWTLAAVGISQFLLSFLRVPGVDEGGGLDLLQWVSLGMIATGGALLIAGRNAHSSTGAPPA